MMATAKRDPSVFLGGLLGCAIGDSIGELATMYFPEEYLLPVINREEKLKYTDDTAMTIGISESLIAFGGIDEGILGRIFKDNYQKEPWRGYSGGPPSVFYLVENKGLSFSDAAGRLYNGTGSFGNGAAMRVMPIGVLYHDSDKMIEAVKVSSKITHSHPYAVEGAVLQAKAVSEAVKKRDEKDLDPHEFLRSLKDILTIEAFIEKIDIVGELLEGGVLAVDAARELGNNNTALESVPFAIFCFLKNHGSFKDCLYDAIFSGGDKDTIGAMACAIAGVYMGPASLPSAWDGKIENRDYISELALKLTKLKDEL